MSTYIGDLCSLSASNLVFAEFYVNGCWSVTAIAGARRAKGICHATKIWYIWCRCSRLGGVHDASNRMRSRARACINGFTQVQPSNQSFFRWVLIELPRHCWLVNWMRISSRRESIPSAAVGIRSEPIILAEYLTRMYWDWIADPLNTQTSMAVPPISVSIDKIETRA